MDAATLNEYRSQIGRAARSLALARHDEVGSDPRHGHAIQLVSVFTRGNLDQRHDKLSAQCEALSDGFEELHGLIADYIREVPLLADDTGVSDGLRFIDWIENREELSDEQRDYLTCQRSRHSIEAVALRKRIAHVRFQDLLSLNARNTAALHEKSKLRLHLNPIHVYATFETRVLLNDEATIPATVLFYPVEDEVRTAVLEPEAADLLDLLADRGSLTVVACMKGRSADERRELLDLVRELAALGILALA